MCGAHCGWHGQSVHQALFYRDEERVLEAVCEFVREGIVRGGPALVALPPPKLERLRRDLRAHPGWVDFHDMTSLGMNPGRILPWMTDWLAGQPGGARVVVEALWPGRTTAERTEVMRHEALIDLAMGSEPAELLCLYAEDLLDGRARRGVERTHRVLRGSDGVRRVSSGYADASGALQETEAALSAPQEPIQELAVTHDLRGLRRTVASSPAARSLPEHRRDDFVLAVNEAATNALKYDCPPRALRLWRSGPYVICEVAGRGAIDDPLAGRRSPSPAAHRGRGLWMVNQLCDLVELRNHDSRATLRMHMRCAQDALGPGATGPGAFREA